MLHSKTSADARRARDWVQIGLFFLALALPSVGYVLGVNDLEMLAENRRLADRPAWPRDRESLRGFPVAFEDHFDDHFGFRSHLVGRDKRLEWLGRRTEVEIQVGPNSWLFQGNQRKIAALACMQPPAPILESWLELGRDRHARMLAMGIAFRWVMAPNKHSVHPEEMPTRTRSALPACDTSSLGQAFAKQAVPLLDLRAPLLDARRGRALYHRTDTHWNQLGAAHAVAQIIESIRVDFPAVPRFSLEDYRVVIDDLAFEGILASRLKVYGERYEEPFVRLERKAPTSARIVSSGPPIDLRVHWREDPLVEFSTGRSDLPTAVIFHDSFGFATMELLAEHFERVQFVNSNARIDWDLLAQNPPDIAIALFVEAKLHAKALEDRAGGSDLAGSAARFDLRAPGRNRRRDMLP